MLRTRYVRGAVTLGNYVVKIARANVKTRASTGSSHLYPSIGVLFVFVDLHPSLELAIEEQEMH